MVELFHKGHIWSLWGLYAYTNTKTSSLQVYEYTLLTEEQSGIRDGLCSVYHSLSNVMDVNYEYIGANHKFLIIQVSLYDKASSFGTTVKACRLLLLITLINHGIKRNSIRGSK